MSSTMRNVAIIGGGIGGMITALLLNRKGWKVTIYEKENQLGGRLAFHEGSDWRIDQGPTIVLLPQMIFDILEEAGIAKEQLNFTLCEPLTSIHFADGNVLHKYLDQEKQVAEIERIAPGEGENFKQYMRDLQMIYEEAKPVFLERTFPRKRSLFAWRNLVTLWRAKTHKSVKSLANRYFVDPRLRHAFSLQTLYIGGAPQQTPGLYSLIPYAEQAFGIWYLQGGYAQLAKLLQTELIKRGVTLSLGKRVEGLQFQGNRCSGVIVNATTTLHDAVVYNGDFPQIQSLLGDKAKQTARKTYQPSSGCILVYLKTDRRWTNLNAHQFFLPSSFDEQLHRIYKKNQMPNEPAYYVFQPQSIDPKLAERKETLLYLLIPVPSAGTHDWEAAAEHLVNQVLNDLEKRALPDLRAAIVEKSVRTPAQAKQFGLFDGGSFGIAPSWLQSGMFRPQIEIKPFEHLYAVGASIHPGGGIPIVMQGARLLAEHLEKELGS